MKPLSAPKVDARAWAQELRSNRKTQAALVVLVAVLAYLSWPEPSRRRTRSTADRNQALPSGEPHPDRLGSLPDLSRFERTGELPDEGRMYRDLFLFDAPPPPPPPPPKPAPPPPPPPPPTPEEIAAAKLALARQEAASAKPQNLRYLGYMGGPSTGRIGTFARGDEILTMRVGESAGLGWKLIALADSYAEFEHQAFPDIRYRAEAREQTGTATGAVTNQF